MSLAQMSPNVRAKFSLPAGVKGLVVTAVDPGSDAHGKVQSGDVIVEMQFEEVHTIAQAQRVAERFGQNNRPVLVYLQRNGEKTFRSIRARRK
jgi:serine protease Do